MGQVKFVGQHLIFGIVACNNLFGGWCYISNSTLWCLNPMDSPCFQHYALPPGEGERARWHLFPAAPKRSCREEKKAARLRSHVSGNDFIVVKCEYLANCPGGIAYILPGEIAAKLS